MKPITSYTAQLMPRLLTLGSLLLIGITSQSQGAVKRGLDVSLATSFVSSVDNNNLAIDDGTGLEWLDLTLTSDLSVLDVRRLIVPGGLLEDFRYGTGIEVLTLFHNLGFEEASFSNNSAIPVLDSSRALYNMAVSLLGDTSSGTSTAMFTGGIINPVSSSNSRFFLVALGEIQRLEDEAISQTFNDSPGSRPYLDTRTGSSHGHFLVRRTSIVPEPDSICLVVLGLLVASGIKGYKRFRH